MNRNSMLKILDKYGISTLQGYRDEAFSRYIGLLSKEEQDLLADVRVAIPGVGGVGGLHLITLVRTGVGKFNPADADILSMFAKIDAIDLLKRLFGNKTVMTPKRGQADPRKN